MKIKLQKLNLENFRGISHFSYDFNGENALFSAKKGVGKTSMLEAIMWALGRKMNDIFPTIDNCIVKDLDTEVSVLLSFDEMSYEFKRTSKQKFKVDKFTEQSKFDGNESEYFIDNYVYKYSDYCNKIQEIFGFDYDDVFKILDISEFNNLKWEDQRKWLIEKSNTEDEIKKLNSKFDLLKDDLDKNVSETIIQKNLNLQEKTIEKEITEIQTKIKDRNSKLSELSSIDFESIEAREQAINKEIDDLILKQKEQSRNVIKEGLIIELASMRDELSNINFKNNDKIAQKEYKCADLENEKKSIERNLKFVDDKLQKIEDDLSDLKIELNDVSCETFDEKQKVCPSCGQQLPEDKITALVDKFENNKKEKIKNINSDLENLSKNKETAIADRNTLLDKNQALDEQISALNNEKIELEDTSSLENKIKEKENEILALDSNEKLDTTIADKISSLKLEYKDCIEQLTNKKRIEEIRNEINTLKEQGKQLGIRDQERIKKQQQLLDYVKEKVKLTEEPINKMFDERIKFLLFTNLVSGELADFKLNCVACLDGTEYTKCSKGQKIECDYLVQLGLQKLFGIESFIFVDEVGSTSIDYQGNNQVIELFTISKVLEKVTDKPVKANFFPSKIKDAYTIDDCIGRG